MLINVKGNLLSPEVLKETGTNKKLEVQEIYGRECLWTLKGTESRTGGCNAGWTPMGGKREWNGAEQHFP